MSEWLFIEYSWLMGIFCGFVVAQMFFRLWRIGLDNQLTEMRIRWKVWVEGQAFDDPYEREDRND